MPSEMDEENDLGEAVVRLTWAGDSAAHIGSATIYAQPTGFLVGTDEETYGPFSTLADALAVDTFHFGDTPGPALTCSPETAALPVLRTAALDLAGYFGGTVHINGVEHVRTADGLTRRL